MAAIQDRVFVVILSFFVIFVSGFSMSRSGKPFNGLVASIHKLLSLATVVFLVLLLMRINHLARLSMVEWIVCAIAVLLIVAAIASGSVMMAVESSPAAHLTHRIVPYLALLSTAAAFWLLFPKLR
jgi:hypothetical protein